MSETPSPQNTKIVSLSASSRALARATQACQGPRRHFCTDTTLTLGLVIAINAVVSPDNIPVSALDLAIVGYNLNVFGLVAEEIGHDLGQQRQQTAADDGDGKFVLTAVVIEGWESRIDGALFRI